MQVPDGSWWFTHQLVQKRSKKKGHTAGKATLDSYEGRSQWLIPVKWKDNWPILGDDPDCNGIGNTVHQYRKPIEGFSITAPQTDDDFGSPALGPQWQWNHNPRNDLWSLKERKGWLRLRAGKPVNDGGFWNAANTISLRLMGKGRHRAVTKIDISNMKPGQEAGFCHHSGQFVLIGIRVSKDGVKKLLFTYNKKETEGPVVKKDIIYFSTDVVGQQASFSYSFDNRSWKSFGDKFNITFGRWRGDRIGFYSWNDKKEAGFIDVDWYKYDYDGPK